VAKILQEDSMKKDVGSKNFEIWLLGDSNPKNWGDVLKTPFDPRHPARHNIWTSVIEVTQDRIFRELRKRIDTTQLYIRNAIEDPSKKPKPNAENWPLEVENKLSEFRQLIQLHKPKVLLSFGAFSFEFARRTLDQIPQRSFGYWGTKKLGYEFHERISKYDLSVTNLFPLLHVSIARGKYIQSHNYFCDKVGANYFEFVGNSIAEMLIDRHQEVDIWVN